MVTASLRHAPSSGHARRTPHARLSALLVPYVQANALGLVYHPRAVVRFEGSEVEPDLIVRVPAPGTGNAWERAPLPSLIVEVASPTTHRRDRTFKKNFYNEALIPEYWIVDPAQIFDDEGGPR